MDSLYGKSDKNPVYADTAMHEDNKIGISLFEIFRSLTSSILILEIIFNVQFSRYHLTDDLSVIQDQKLSELGSLVNTSVYKHLCR